MNRKSIPVIDRVMHSVIKTPEGCWIYNGYVGKDGYCKIHVGRRGSKKARVHRVVYEHYFGPIPEGLLVCHTCDNTRCCNPSHLFLGTDKDNMVDKQMKGRQAFTRGESSGLCKITSQQVLAIRKDGRPIKEIAHDYHCSKSTVSMIRNLKSRIYG